MSSNSFRWTQTASRRRLTASAPKPASTTLSKSSPPAEHRALVRLIEATAESVQITLHEKPKRLYVIDAEKLANAILDKQKARQP
jgi:hypothetical protein